MTGLENLGKYYDFYSFVALLSINTNLFKTITS